MKKKSILISLLLLLAMLAGVVLWPAVPEYGDSYSEQQRKLWNERRALYPMAWGKERGYDLSGWTVSRLTGKNRDNAESFAKQKAIRNKELAAEQMQLRDAEKLDFQLDRNVPLDFSSLPASQVSVRECLKRARGGDADACLMMAFHLGWNGLTNQELLSWGRARDVSFWLGRAEDFKRPGTRFLRNFMTMILPENRKREVIGKGKSTEYPCPDYTGLPGYAEWQQCLRNGDLLAYYLFKLLAADHVLPKREKSLLMEALRKKAKSGDVSAMEKMCSLVFDQYFDMDWSQYIDDEMIKTRLGKMIGMLPDFMRESTFLSFVRMGIVSAEDTETMREFRETAVYAHEAARRGSLAGMYYWFQYGQASLNTYTRDDWEEVFLYHRMMLERGYIPFIWNWDRGYKYPLERELLESYYPPKTLLDVHNWALTRSGLKDELPWRTDVLLPKTKHKDEVLRLLDEQIALMGADAVLYEMLKNPNCWNVTHEVAEAYVVKVKELAGEGGPLAKLVLGYLYENGLGVSRDLVLAWNCYSEARDAVGIFGLELVLYWDPTSDDKYQLYYMQLAPSVLLLSLGVRFADFPGRDEAKLYTLARDLDQYSKSDHAGKLNYLLGRVYEDGIGTPVDKGRAREYYKRGRSSYTGCAERLERLGEDELDSSEQN